MIDTSKVIAPLQVAFVLHLHARCAAIVCSIIEDWRG